jgi:hypothetical protein
VVRIFDVDPHEGGTDLMSHSIMTVVVAIAVALPPVGIAASKSTHTGAREDKIAQYCVPRQDDPIGATRVYC